MCSIQRSINMSLNKKVNSVFQRLDMEFDQDPILLPPRAEKLSALLETKKILVQEWFQRRKVLHRHALARLNISMNFHKIVSSNEFTTFKVTFKLFKFFNSSLQPLPEPYTSPKTAIAHMKRTEAKIKFSLRFDWFNMKLIDEMSSIRRDNGRCFLGKEYLQCKWTIFSFIPLKYP